MTVSRSSRPVSRTAAVIAAAAAIACLPACAGHHKAEDLGVRRLTLDLVFKATTKAAASPTAPTAQTVPVASQMLAALQPVATVGQVLSDISAEPAPGPSTPAAALASCPTAPAGAVPAEPVIGVVGRPPTPGTYSQHNKGQFSLDGPLRLSGLYPPISTMEIGNLSDTTGSDAAGGRVRTIAYDMVVRSPLGTTTTRYQSVIRDSAPNLPTAPTGVVSELDLVSVQNKSASGVTTFTPTPPVTLMQYGGEGSLWKSTGVDTSSGTVMVVQGTITQREPIDVCGAMIDTYRVESTEQVTNQATSYNSQTKSGDPNVYNVATQFGGLIVQEHTDTTTTFPAPGGTETLIVDNTSTVDSVTPKASAH